MRAIDSELGLRPDYDEGLHAVLQQFFPYAASIADAQAVPQLLGDSADEFCFSYEFSTAMVSAICQVGCYPMANSEFERPLFLVKSHRQRCVLSLGEWRPSQKLKRYAKGLTVTVDHAFADCLKRIAEQHPDNWLVPELAAVFLALHHESENGISFHSVECWKDGMLVAGDIGFVNGAVFSGVSRFHSVDSSGSVLLACNAELLQREGFLCFDLGMPAPYKEQMGARILGRFEFLDAYREHSIHRATLHKRTYSAVELLGRRPLL